jgi:hypothetical protein
MAEPRKRRRKLRILVVLLLGLVLGGLLPRLATPLVRGRIEAELAARTGGEASIGELDLTWRGARVRGLAATDPGGEEVLRLGALDVAIQPLALLSGRLRFELTGSDAQVVLRQREDGTWNAEDWLADEEAGDDEEETEAEDGDDAEDDRLAGTWSVDGVRLLLHGPSGTTTVEDLATRGRLRGRALPELELTCAVVGPSGERGELRVSGDVESAEAGRVALEARDVALSVLDPFLAPRAPGRTHTGTLQGDLNAALGAGAARVEGELRVNDLVVRIPGEEGEAPLVLREPTVTLVVDATLDPATLDVPEASLDVASTFLRGTLRASATGLAAWRDPARATPAVFETLEARLLYRPEELGALLGPWLPVPLSRRLSGAEEERIDVDLAGTVAAPDLESLFAGLTGEAVLGLGRVSTPAIDAEGDLELGLTPDGTTYEARLASNGGRLTLSGAFGLGATEEGGTTLHLDADTIEATSRLSPLLAIVHPAFAAVETLQRSELAGVVGCHLDLTYTGPLSRDVLTGGWDAFPTTSIAGRGRFEITGARLAGAPALNRMLELLGADPEAEIRIRPMEFVIDAGRLTYADDWTWTIADVETTFTGSVGLDETLDLSWNVPITAQVIEEHGFLEVLEGRTIALPITGTTQRPELEWDEALKDLTESLGPRDLLEELGIDTGLPGSSTGEEEGDDPAALLARANRLWEEDRKVEAAALYRRIREDHKLSLVYALNRDRIKRRGKHGE